MRHIIFVAGLALAVAFPTVQAKEEPKKPAQVTKPAQQAKKPAQPAKPAGKQEIKKPKSASIDCKDPANKEKVECKPKVKKPVMPKVEKPDAPAKK
jgi:hypothetical protein